MAAVFQPNVFQNNVFQTDAGVRTITDTDVLQKPINCVLAGQQHYKFSWHEWHIPQSNTTSKGRVHHTRPRRLKGVKPSFTVKTSNKGYD